MATPNEKSALHESLRKDSGDAGSPEVQVAFLTARINELTPYFKANPKSQQGRRGLLKMVNKRKQMLSYLKSKDQGRYNELIRKLGLRPERPPSKMLEFKNESPRSLPVATNEDAPSMDKSEHSPHIGYEVANQKYGLQIAFASGRNPPLTPNLLVETVAPLIQAVFQLQRTMQPKQHVKQRIARVSQSSPIEVALEGVADAYKALREDIIPWRRRHQQELAELAAAEQTQDIARKKAEVALAEAQTATQLGEARKAMAESEKIEQEVEAARFALNRAKFEFIVEMAAKMLPNGSDIERIELVTRLLPNVETLLFSSAEIRPLIGTSGPGTSPTSEA